MSEIRITPLGPSLTVRAQLSDILIETVANGDSIGFMHPVTPEAANDFWDGALAAAERGERIVLGAWDGDELLGTVSVLLAMPVNQPHRGEIAKMMTRPSARRRGAATTLMQRAEELAVEHGKTLLVLDTASHGTASRLYERVGFTFVGEFPDYALKPHGGLTATRLYYKRIGPGLEADPS
ncbi:N-acetyltransferase [Deinococcus aetherius]|uniref:N-acetyltransferase n=1 Tax=Deinococcus aetherius TaxID=200252 RepID=A0ABN6RJH6_9DEIO|nr:GNAT family N-acetyltransferase [Deinococcus aetherius]BDP43009.1 N-acetyltransferase [Deinococcus aetherius]